MPWTGRVFWSRQKENTHVLDGQMHRRRPSGNSSCSEYRYTLLTCKSRGGTAAQSCKIESDGARLYLGDFQLNKEGGAYLVWQYWQLSPVSQFAGSPHSSAVFTAGQGVLRYLYFRGLLLRSLLLWNWGQA